MTTASRLHAIELLDLAHRGQHGAYAARIAELRAAGVDPWPMVDAAVALAVAGARGAFGEGTDAAVDTLRLAAAFDAPTADTGTG